MKKTGSRLIKFLSSRHAFSRDPVVFAFIRVYLRGSFAFVFYKYSWGYLRTGLDQVTGSKTEQPINKVLQS